MTSGKPTSSHLDCSFMTWGGQQHIPEDRHRTCSVNVGYSHGNNPSFTFSHAVKQKFMVIRELARGLEERHWYEPVVCERKEQVLGYESPPSVHRLHGPPRENSNAVAQTGEQFGVADRVSPCRVCESIKARLDSGTFQCRVRAALGGAQSHSGCQPAR